MAQKISKPWGLRINIEGQEVPKWLIGLILFVPAVILLSVGGGLVLLALLAGVSPDAIGKIFAAFASVLH